MIKSISKGYQITIPAEWRNKLGLTVGSKVDMEKKNNKIIIKPIEEMSLDDIYKESKKFKKHNLTPEQIEAMDSDIYD
tara:strand:- start:326 stop:559 length:234 start_codon:yes stop_codon:yes gene_type:complete